ncbi:MAG TPA: TonB family protein [Dongiaceae bacterium]|nr:TonB family protein [Dongiaceae bacterium]
MAPILKEADTPSATTTATTPASPASKSPNETPTRPQPVPLEIPVTVNGARTVEGSDKREPFSETTFTVLVFPHGAVIRIATPLAPGQLVFLTNEKTKKEVVCQVLKSKTGGSASGYVELQFTEPAPAFWGLRLPGAVPPPSTTAPAVPRPAATVPPPSVKPVTPAVTPAAQIPTSPIPAVAPPPPPVPTVHTAPPQLATPVAPVAPISTTASPAAPKLPTPVPVQSASVDTARNIPLVSVPPPSPLSPESIPSTIHKSPKPLIPPPAEGPRDFSKEIESLFAVPQAPASGATKPAAPVTSPSSTEELKQQAARLQQQLGALLFTEAPAAPVKPTSPEFKAEPPVAEVANKVFEIAQTEGRPTDHPEPKTETKFEGKPASAVHTPAFSSLNASDEEVAVPAWLRPLSQHGETFAEEPPAAEATQASASEASSSAIAAMEAVGSSTRSEATVFGGQLLAGESIETAAPSSGSKKGLFVGLAAAVVLLAGGAWYYTTQMHPVTNGAPTTQTSTPPAPAEKLAVTTEDVPSTTSTASRSANNVAAPPASASVNPAVTPQRSAPAQATSPVNETRNSNAVAARNAAPPPEPPKKPSLGDVRLSTPIVRGSGQATGSGESLPSIDAPAPTSNTDALAAASHGKGPTAPLPIGGDVKPAQLIKSVPPVYPTIAKSQRISGNVALDALIDASGNVAEVKVLSGPPLLHRAALEAVKQWKYSPAQLDGSATSMHLTVTVQFRAQ